MRRRQPTKERDMTRYAIVASALLLLSTSGFAQSSYDTNGWGRQAAWPSQQAWTPPSQRIYNNGNSCGPDHAEPVWGPGNALIGYSCEPESANGG
jgi:hypothetical protein